MLALNKKKTKEKTTTSNREYNIARKGPVDCIVCGGLCGLADRRRRNLGKMPKYKNIDRTSLKNFNMAE